MGQRKKQQLCLGKMAFTGNTFGSECGAPLNESIVTDFLHEIPFEMNG